MRKSLFFYNKIFVLGFVYQILERICEIIVKKNKNKNYKIIK